MPWIVADVSENCYRVECSTCGAFYMMPNNVPFEEWKQGRHKAYCGVCGQPMRGQDSGKETYTLDDVARIMLSFVNDECPCNYPRADEWLPGFCRFVKSGECPDPPDTLDCWREYVRYYMKRKEED